MAEARYVEGGFQSRNGAARPVLGCGGRETARAAVELASVEYAIRGCAVCPSRALAHAGLLSCGERCVRGGGLRACDTRWSHEDGPDGRQGGMEQCSAGRGRGTARAASMYHAHWRGSNSIGGWEVRDATLMMGVVGDERRRRTRKDKIETLERYAEDLDEDVDAQQERGQCTAHRTYSTLPTENCRREDQDDAFEVTRDPAVRLGRPVAHVLEVTFGYQGVMSR
ncbi:hypothetical protein C8J57DRAFT_1233943 [Mycena rebaudengoi]|nr:hypothetical protein C8J57DRAFT_1233943 [Mycena rebaudengoi]